MNKDAVKIVTTVAGVGCSFVCGFCVNEYFNRRKFKEFIDRAMVEEQKVVDGLKEQAVLIELLKKIVTEKDEEC